MPTLCPLPSLHRVYQEADSLPPTECEVGLERSPLHCLRPSRPCQCTLWGWSGPPPAPKFKGLLPPQTHFLLAPTQPAPGKGSPGLSFSQRPELQPTNPVSERSCVWRIRKYPGATPLLCLNLLLRNHTESEPHYLQ